MSQNRAHKTASLRVQIGSLQAEERRLHEVINSMFTAPEIRTQARNQLQKTLKTLMDAFGEIARLESEQ